MPTLQNMPEELKRFILQHQLIQPEHFTGESQLGVQLLLPRVIDLVLSSLSELAGQASGREVIWNMARETTDTNGLHTSGPSATIASQQYTGIIKNVLDDRYHGSVNAIATVAGWKPASVAHLIEVVAAAAFSIMGSMIAENRWNAQQLGSWLRPDQSTSTSPLPLAVPLAVTATANSVYESTMPVSAAESWFSRNTSKLLVAVSLLATAEFGYILSTRPNSNSDLAGASSVTVPSETEVPPTSDAYTAQPVSNITSATAPATAVTSKALAVPVVLKLKNGLRQINAANSTESKLYEFLIDQNQEVDLADPTKGWIGFDRIYFESNKAILTNESLWQLSNVASILKRFPNAKIKVGGYTDSSGSPFINLKLSKERAQAAMASLISLGVPSDHVVAVGYGSLDNIATNDTDEGRALNRRVSMQVIQK